MSRRVFEHFAEAGGNFIDTAAPYAGGNSERTIGRLLADIRDDFVVATKYSIQSSVPPLRAGNSRRNLRLTVEQSLTRLNTDYIDILYVHAWDFTTQWWEILSGLDDLTSSGKVQYVAVSNTPAWEISRAVTMAELRGWEPFIGIQARYSLLDRSPERDLLPMAKELDLGVAAWSPLGGGILAQRGEAAAADKRGVPLSTKARLTARAVQTMAASRGCTPAQVAIAWLRATSPRWGGVIPVVGCRTDDELDDVLGACSVELTPDELTSLGAVSEVDRGYPHDLIEGDYFRELLSGGNAESIVNHRR